MADFQPRIALVTRTLNRSMSDLVHFAVLFCSITLGYSIAGVLLFGHQYEGFATFTAALIYLVVMLINWDPYQWIQVCLKHIQTIEMRIPKYLCCCELQLDHASPDWMLNVYIWSWFFLAFFILVFLALYSQTRIIYLKCAIFL